MFDRDDVIGGFFSDGGRATTLAKGFDLFGTAPPTEAGDDDGVVVVFVVGGIVDIGQESDDVGLKRLFNVVGTVVERGGKSRLTFAYEFLTAST